MIQILVFVCGFIDEWSCVGFVQFSEADRPIATALCSMLSAAVSITGVYEAVHDWRVAPFFVVGFGAGGFFGVMFKRWRKAHG